MGYRVLIADDQWDTVEGLADILKDNGHTVFPAHDGDEALDVLRREKVDILLLDLRMPKKQGHEVLRAMRNELHIKLPVIVITSVLDWEKEKQSLRQLAMSEGAYYQFLKPVNPEELLNFMGSLLDPNHPQYVHVVVDRPKGLWGVRGTAIEPL
ncbi:MAG: response regulator transcription factor [Elusimicrobia bacterium]|nr:response regulator transcription factor [Elusimicrobiota bacterium]